MTRRPRGFTLAEMMVVTALIAIIAVMVLPQIGSNDRARLLGAAAVLRSDLELAQVMTIADPQAPVVMRFDPDGVRYWIAYRATPDDPVRREGSGEPYIVTLGDGRASSADGVALAVSEMPDATLAFDAHGGLVAFASTPSIELSMGKERLVLRIDAMTGSVSEGP